MKSQLAAEFITKKPLKLGSSGTGLYVPRQMSDRQPRKVTNQNGGIRSHRGRCVLFFQFTHKPAQLKLRLPLLINNQRGTGLCGQVP
ncbi:MULTISPECIES: hypothetical protein [Burkholderia]|uniref:hypothetical protein n=1 Tax=Burkholderia TaxID=32008 RepID=UPI0014858FFD|nr:MULTISPECIES: hypothetical protein [Burkholderia]MBR8093877.1 hypothetical protein [Burkholderia cenocepacia]